MTRKHILPVATGICTHDPPWLHPLCNINIRVQGRDFQKKILRHDFRTIYADLKTSLLHYDNLTNTLNIVNITKYINVNIKRHLFTPSHEISGKYVYVMLCNYTTQRITILSKLDVFNFLTYDIFMTNLRRS